MKAAIWYGRRDVRVLDVPEPPAPGPGEVKVKVHWCGICGSDLHEYTDGPISIPVEKPHPLTGKKAPIIIGHEFSGEIVGLGEGVTNVKVGDRVSPNACHRCATCPTCKQNRYNLCEKLAFTGIMTDGAFAEYVNVPAYTAYKLPAGVSSELGALVEPLAVGAHAIRRGRVSEGDVVAIVGAGTIGLAALQMARAAGAGAIFSIEIAKERKDLARKLGATAVLDPREIDVVEEVRRLTDGQGADVVVECVGSEAATALTVQLARRGGRVVIAGIFDKPIRIHPNDIVHAELEVYGSMAYLSEFDTVIDLLASGQIYAEPLITDRIKLDEIVEKGFEELLLHRDRHIKILVFPG